MDARRWTLRLTFGWAAGTVAWGLVSSAPAQTTVTTSTGTATLSFQIPAPAPAVPAPAVQATPAATAVPAAAPTPAPAPGQLPANVFATGPNNTAQPPDAPKTPEEQKKAAEEAQKKAAEDQKKAMRLQKLQQVNFDRRPSAILKAWTLTDEAALQENKPKPPEPGAGPAVANVPQPNNPNQPNPQGPDPFDDEIFLFRRNVTKGDWPAVAKWLHDLPEPEGKAAYKQLIAMLPNSIPSMPGMGGMNPQQQQQMMMQQQQQQLMQQQQGGMNPQYMEKTTLIARDVVALAEAAPHGQTKETIAGFGPLLKIAVERGDSVEHYLALIRAGRAATPPRSGLNDREVAKVLLAANLPTEMKAFLPEPEKAEADNDREGLNLLSRYYLAAHAKEKKVALLEQAWKVTLAVLAVGEVTPEAKEEALKRAVELAPKVEADLGLKWLEESFTKRPERGMEIIAAIGAASWRGLATQGPDPDAREKALQLQKTAVEALLRSPVVAPEAGKPAPPADWSKSLALLAGAWLNEAEFSQQYDTSTSLGPRMQRDIYGNFFYYNNQMMNNGMYGRNGNFPQAISVGKVLLAMPGPEWVAKLDDGVRPKYAAVVSKLYLKVDEDEKAFPYVEDLARTHPEQARELAEEFLRVWTKNHDPNAERNMRNPYIYMYGFERKAESIPLTRSKQDRNLKELAMWVDRLRKLPIRELDEKLIARAFTACHSSAEVYRLDMIEAVLGKFDLLKPETLATMAQQMRTNLAGLWRNPATQDQNKTKRKEKDIRAEVLRGYEVARAVVDQGLAKHPESWNLMVVRASIRHDENNYRQEVDPSLRFSKGRNEALAMFRQAAEQYAKKVPTLSEDEETIEAFETWFYAGLGACDLGAIDEKNQADPKQPPLIREALQKLPGAAAARHMNKFANALFTRMSALSPQVKFRYLKGGFEVVGDNEQAAEAKKVYDYYKDLVTEIKLETLVDGPAEVGSGEPFGLFVNLKHTREIEREAGGFGKYLQNQNTGNNFFYNYGRPLENYRDKFQDIVKKAFEEQFEVMSVTFQDEKVNSRATPEYGWRYTPYAYVLLKAKSPQVDKIPPVRLDLDFLDTSGYVIMPVESPTIPIDAATTRSGSRPYEKLQLAQTLDERQAKDGKLILEVKATAQGLVPPLEEIVDLKSADFKVAKAEDQGLSVSRFDPDADGNTIVSERTWLVTMTASDDLKERPTKFKFPEPRVATAETIYQRFVDADLAKVGPDVDLEAQYGEPSRAWIYWTIGGVASVAVLTILAYRFRPRAAVAKTGRFALPEAITPFSVLGLLREIQLQDAVPEGKRRELAAAIAALESRYFAGSDQAGPDLAQVADQWVRQAS